MWKPIATAPIGKFVLLWNDDIEEISIGYRPPDAPSVECVVVNLTASYADAWQPLPDPPEVSDDEDGE